MLWILMLFLSLVGMVSTPPGEGNNDDSSQDDDDGDDDGDDDDSSQDDDERRETQIEDVEGLKRELARARRDAAKHRTRARDTDAKYTDLQSKLDGIAKALGQENGEELDPDKLQTELETTRKQLRQERMRNTFSKVSRKLNADDALSWAYLYSSGDLDNIDTEDNLSEALEERLKSALDENPKLKADDSPPPRSNSDNDSNGDANRGKLTMNQLIRRSAGRD